MAVQTNYSENIRAGVAGMIANMEAADLISREVETTAGIGFGVPVQQGTADKQVDIVGAGATEVVGITVRERSVNPATPEKFAVKETARLIRKGVIYAVNEGGVSAGDEVWVTLADGTFTNADAGSDGSIQLAGCRWDSSAADGEIALLRVNLDIPAVLGAS